MLLSLIKSLKELSLCHKLWFLNIYICATKCCRPLIFQTMNSVISNNLSLKYQRFTPPSCKEALYYLILWFFCVIFCIEAKTNYMHWFYDKFCARQVLINKYFSFYSLLVSVYNLRSSPGKGTNRNYKNVILPAQNLLTIMNHIYIKVSGCYKK